MVGAVRGELSVHRVSSVCSLLNQPFFSVTTQNWKVFSVSSAPGRGNGVSRAISISGHGVEKQWCCFWSLQKKAAVLQKFLFPAVP